MRQDVIELVRELKVPIVRYPAATSSRPTIGKTGLARASDGRRLDLAWRTSGSNQVGVHEFAQWCQSANTEMMLAINLGSRGLDHAQFRRVRERPDWQRVGRPAQGAWSRRAVRRQALVPRQRDGWAMAGRPQDRRRIWPPRQREAKTLRAFDRSLELIVCGSSNAEYERPIPSGSASSSSTPTTQSTTSRCTVFRQSS